MTATPRRGLPPVHSLMETQFPTPAARKEQSTSFPAASSLEHAAMTPSLTLHNTPYVSQLSSSGLFPAPAAEDSLWAQWVVVFGFSADTAVASLFDLLATYGHVLEHAPGTGNWAYFRFSSPREAARCAEAMNGRCVSGAVMLGVSQLSPALARLNNLRLDSAGALDCTVFGQEGVRLQTRPQRDVFKPSRVNKSVCARIIEFFFFS